jgi:hypothetical protein
MAFLTLDELRQYPNQFSFGQRAAARQSITTKSASTRTTVFLSHSHHDADLIEPALLFFTQQGVAVYVDWKDPTMAAMTTPGTATQIKGRIMACQKFVVLATNNALGSRWVPWELGIADSSNGMERIAILPVVDRHQTWNGNEYIGIYARIDRASDGRWAVFPAGNNRGQYLDEWLRN